MKPNAGITAVDESIEEGILREILLKHKSEVKDMVLTEFKAERHDRTLREEGRMEGRVEGRMEGREEELLSLVRDGMLTVEQAAPRIGKTEEEFRAMLCNGDVEVQATEA